MSIARLAASTTLAAVAAASAHAAPLEDLNRCMDAAERREDLRACIGAFAGPCIEARGTGSSDVVACLEEEADVWDARLNDAWGRLRERYRVTDATTTAGQASDPIWPTLVSAQRAWLAFRDAECAAVIAGMGGSGRRESDSDCRLRMTAERVVDLRFEHASDIGRSQ